MPTEEVDVNTANRSDPFVTRPIGATSVEGLESRRLLSAVLQDGVLSVNGTAMSDDIRVYFYRGEPAAPAVYVVEIGPIDGERPTRTWEFPAADVRLVVVRAGGGNDVVDLGVATFPVPMNLFTDVGPVAVPTRVDGGVGNDRMYGGTNRDMIIDLFGDDVIAGLAGHDWINAGWGNDTVYGNTGNDYLLGGPGTDTLVGQDGDDSIWGGSGDDVLTGDFGNDRLFGGAGNDRLGRLPVGPLAGEVGNDFMDGGDGTDRIFGGVGTDRLFGGPGRDVWLEGWSPAEKDTPAERVDRTPDEPVEMIPATV